MLQTLAECSFAEIDFYHRCFSSLISGKVIRFFAVCKMFTQALLPTTWLCTGHRAEHGGHFGDVTPLSLRCWQSHGEPDSSGNLH